MPALLAVLFLVMPLVELYVILQVGSSIGVLPTIALLLLDSIVGAWLVKREGAKAWRAFRRAIEEARVPARETADGALIIFGGALLLTPGFVTDILGLACVVPPTRALMRRALVRFFSRRVTVLGTVPSGRPARIQRVRSERAPAADRRPANVPPPD